MVCYLDMGILDNRPIYGPDRRAIVGGRLVYEQCQAYMAWAGGGLCIHYDDNLCSDHHRLPVGSVAYREFWRLHCEPQDLKRKGAGYGNVLAAYGVGSLPPDYRRGSSLWPPLQAINAALLITARQAKLVAEAIEAPHPTTTQADSAHAPSAL